MKTRLFFSTCYILATITAFAGTYTINVPNGVSLIANHLDNPPNDLNTILGSSLPNKTTFQKWNCIAFTSSTRAAAAWSPNQTFVPGEGAIVNNPGPAVLVTFNGTPIVPVLPAASLCPCGIPSLVSCQTTSAPSSFTDITGLPPTEGTKLYRHNVGMPAALDNVNYTEHTFTSGAWTPGDPQVDLGEAVWVLIPCPPCLTVDCSTNKVVECGSAWSFDLPTVVSNCCGTNVTITVLNTTTNGSCPEIVTRVWQIDDLWTNSVTCTQTVTVVDSMAPVLSSVLCMTNQTDIGTTNDDFAGAEPAFPSVGLATRLQANVLKGFDDCAQDSHVAHNFTNLPPCITGATLCVRLIPCGGSGNDAFGLSFTGSDGTLVPGAGSWSRFIGGGQTQPGLITNNWNSASVTNGVEICLDLSAMPLAGGGTINLLPFLNQNGFLDFHCQDDTAVDYLRLEVTACCCATNKTVECGTAWAFDPPAAIDACCGTNLSYELLSSNSIVVSPCLTIWEGLWQVSDCCSNSVICSQTVNVVDTTAPVLICASDKTVECGTVWSFDPPSAFDACCTNVSIELLSTNNTVVGPCPAVWTALWQAMDCCSNISTCTQTVTVVDSTVSTNCCDGCTTNSFVSYTVNVKSGINLLVNHLCHGTNHTLDAVLPIVPDGTSLQKWDYTAQNFTAPDTYFATIGWLDANFNPSTTTLEPGEGFVLNNPDAAFDLVIEGCEPTCPAPCLPINGCVLVGRLGIGTAAWTNLSSCPPVCLTRVSRWNGTSYDNYEYMTAWTPEPVLEIGESAFVCLDTCVCPCPNATNAPAPSNDLCVNATAISAGIHYGYTFNATPSLLASITPPNPCGQSLASPDVWYVFTAPCPGGIVTLDTCLDPCFNLPSGGNSAPFDTVLSVYSGTCPLLTQIKCNDNAINACTNAPLSSKLTFKALPCVPYYIRVAGHLGATGCFALNATFQAVPTVVPGNNACANATLIKCNETKSFSTCMATTEGPVSPGCTFDKDVWFKYVPPCSGTVSVDTCGSFFDTVLGVYDGSCNNLNLLACNDTATTGPCAGSVQSKLTFQASAGTTYFIRVGGTNGTACTGKLTVIGPNTNTACPPTGPCVKRQRLFQLVGASTGNGWSWCLSSPCCFSISGTVPAGTVPAGAPASALVAAMVASINAVCPDTAFQLAGNNASKFLIKACICANCPSASPFVFRVGADGASCDDMCVVNSPIIASTAGPCVFNPGISEVPLAQQDCNQNGEDDAIDILEGTSPDHDENGVPDECQIRLNLAYESLDNEVAISWAATDAILEQSASADGPWDEVPGATSPHIITPASGQEFFRLRLP